MMWQPLALSFQIALVAAGLAGLVAVPVAALQRHPQGWCVFIPTEHEGAFELRPVGRGRDLAGEVEILSGLQEGELVVVDGAFLLKAEADKQRGGGALLDLAGLAAATAHRGVRHIRIPTTTLSQCDSGVGVKNGINAFGKKNFIGTFAPPFAVINDFDLLASLPARDKRAGYVEAVKVALIRDSAFFNQIERDADKLAAFDADAVLAGGLTPVFFGSAVNNFGVQLLLDAFLDMAPPPRPRQVNGQTIEPQDPAFSGFIFKIQANMDPRHRDRLAFVRICSGRFERDMMVFHTRTGRKLRLSSSHKLFARTRETVDEASGISY